MTAGELIECLKKVDSESRLGIKDNFFGFDELTLDRLYIIERKLITEIETIYKRLE